MDAVRADVLGSGTSRVRVTRSTSRQSAKDATPSTLDAPASATEPDPLACRLILKNGTGPDCRFYRDSFALEKSQMKRDLSEDELRLLRSKQSKSRSALVRYQALLDSSPSTSTAVANGSMSTILATLITNAASATLIYAAETAGTAVCISSDGLLLTCSHCIAESEEEFSQKGTQQVWLVFSNGRPVGATCVAWDPKRDLALLKITASCVEQPLASDTAESFNVHFPFVEIARTGPKRNAPLLCFGQPGAEDFEVDEPGVRTGYDVFHISEGAFRGNAKGQDVQDNSEIGALMHDCWTYWGHSGAPLISKTNGELVGLHSSWDDETGMRRGIGLQAIQAFLEEHTVAVSQAR